PVLTEPIDVSETLELARASTIMQTASAHGFEIREEDTAARSLLDALGLSCGEDQLAKATAARAVHLAKVTMSERAAFGERLAADARRVAEWSEARGDTAMATLAKAAAAAAPSARDVLDAIYKNPVRPETPSRTPYVDRRPDLAALRERQR